MKPAATTTTTAAGFLFSRAENAGPPIAAAGATLTRAHAHTRTLTRTYTRTHTRARVRVKKVFTPNDDGRTHARALATITFTRVRFFYVFYIIFRPPCRRCEAVACPRGGGSIVCKWGRLIKYATQYDVCIDSGVQCTSRDDDDDARRRDLTSQYNIFTLSSLCGTCSVCVSDRARVCK